MIWILVHPGAQADMLGYLPDWLREEDPRPARMQLDEGYKHAGGWRPTLLKFTISEEGELIYPGDPPTPILAETQLRNETVRVYLHDWVAIIQKDGTFEVMRMD